jgi:hypothetical protein
VDITMRERLEVLAFGSQCRVRRAESLIQRVQVCLALDLARAAAEATDRLGIVALRRPDRRAERMARGIHHFR